jgi:Na+-driven multidrug efflux pump
MTDENKGAARPPEKISSSHDNVVTNDETTAHISYRQHLQDVFKLTCPIILSELFQNKLPLMDIAFVGQLG